jgi:hypothetical protein
LVLLLAPVDFVAVDRLISLKYFPSLLTQIMACSHFLDFLGALGDSTGELEVLVFSWRLELG